MSEVDRFLFENEKILFEEHHGFLPSLFGEETLYLTNLRSIKVVSPGFFSRKTFMFLPHAVARGQAVAPTWYWTAMIVYGLITFVLMMIVTNFVLSYRDRDSGMFLTILLVIIVALVTGKRQVFAIFGEPVVNIVIKDEQKSEEALKIITKLQDDILNKKL